MIIKIAEKIESKIDQLEKARKELDSAATEKVESLIAYEKVLAVTLVRLRNGEEYLFEGNKIKDPPVSIIKEITKGICWQDRLESDAAEVKYKNILAIIEIRKAQLNGYQSIFRHLEEV